MQAWMWRLTDEHAVLYTDDRATLKALFTYSRFPHQDLSRATTYERKNGRVFAWQFTFPISAWNGVVRFLGRSSITMLDQERGGQATVTNTAPVPAEIPDSSSGSSKKGERLAITKPEVAAAPARAAKAKTGKPVADLSQPLQPMETPVAKVSRNGKGQVTQPAAQPQPEPVSRPKKADTAPVVEVVIAVAAPAAAAAPTASTTRQPAKKKSAAGNVETAAVPVPAAASIEVPVAVTRGRTAKKVATVPVADAAHPVSKPGRSKAAGAPSAIADAATPTSSRSSATLSAVPVQSSPTKTRPGRKSVTTAVTIAEPEAQPGKVARDAKVPTAFPQVKPLAVEKPPPPAGQVRKPVRATPPAPKEQPQQAVLELSPVTAVILPDLVDSGKPRRGRARVRDAEPHRKIETAVALGVPRVIGTRKSASSHASDAHGQEKPKRAASSGSATRVAAVPEPVGRAKRPKSR